MCCNCKNNKNNNSNSKLLTCIFYILAILIFAIGQIQGLKVEPIVVIAWIFVAMMNLYIK